MVNAGFNPLEEIARKTGKSIGELKEEMSKGAISSKMVQDAFISATSAGGKFFGMSQEGAKTLNGQISMLQESFDMMFNEIGQKGEGVVMDAVKLGTSLVENYERVGKVLAGLVVTYGLYKTALVLSTQMTNGMTMAQVLHTTVTKALTVAEEALNKTILANPYVLAAVALGTLITAVVLAGDSMTATERAQDNYNKKIEENSKLVKEEKDEIDKLIGTLEDETSSIESKNIAFNTLIVKYPTIFSKYKTEKELIENITEARQRENAEIERKTELLGQKSYNESKTRATELNRLKYLQENGDIRGLQTQGGYKKGKDQDEYIKLWYKYHDEIKKTQTWYGTESGAIDRLASTATEEYKLNINENRKKQIAKYNANIGNLSKGQAQKELAKLRYNLKRMDKSGKDYLTIDNNEPLSRAQIKERITLLENNVKTERKTMAQWRNEAKKEAKMNRKAAKELASSTELLTKDQAEKMMKKATDAVSNSEKAINRFEFQDKSNGNKRKSGKTKVGIPKQEDYNKLARERSDLERELADKSSQVYIDSLQNGYEKEKKQRELNHKKELDDLEKYKRDFLQKKISDAKQIFEADTKNKGKKFNAASVTLTKDEQDKFDKMRSDTIKKHINEDKEAEDERIRNARAAWQAYYHNFGTYAEKRKDLQEELNDKLAEIDRKSITDSQKQAEKATLTKQYANQFDELDNSVKNSTTLMGQLFADASKKSISEIEDVIDKTQLLLSYLEAVKDENGNATINGKNVSRKDLLGLGISENALSNLEQDPTKIESIRSALDRLKGELGAKSPFELLKKEIKEAGKELNKGSKQNIANGIMAIADAVHSFLPSVKEFGNSLGTIFGDELGDKIGRATDALDGLATTGKGVGQIMSGDIVGGTMSAINGISQVINALDGMFGADYSHYNEMVERYNTLNSIWDSLIDKKLKYINTSYGMEAQMVADEAIQLANKSQESYRILGKERLNSGASAGSHSIGVRQRKKMSSEGWSELRSITREIGLDYNSIAGGRMTGLFDLTAEQLSKLKDGAQTFWAQLDNDVRKYLDGIIDGDERIQEIQRKQKEQLAQISFDGLFDGFVDKLMDMKTSWTDFSKDASTIFMKAVMTNQIGIQFHKKLQEWYDKFAKSTEGGITEDERKSLTDEYKGYVDEAIKMRDELAKTVGYDVASTEQKATTNGLSQISYEQAANLIALTTAGNISRDQIKDVLLSQKLSSIDLSLTGISLIGKDAVSIADETRTILANSYMELKEINENTGVSAKCLTQIDENIKSMNRLIKDKL
nr:MAG TPA: tail tape measure protein [Crassvirales sp.]